MTLTEYVNKWQKWHGKLQRANLKRFKVTCEDSWNHAFALEHPEIFRIEQTAEQAAARVPKVTIVRIWKHLEQ